MCPQSEGRRPSCELGFYTLDNLVRQIQFDVHLVLLHFPIFMFKRAYENHCPCPSPRKRLPSGGKKSIYDSFLKERNCLFVSITAHQLLTRKSTYTALSSARPRYTYTLRISWPSVAYYKRKEVALSLQCKSIL